MDQNYPVLILFIQKAAVQNWTTAVHFRTNKQ
jgi:hypothetical protein